MSGAVRIVDMPDLGAVTDSSSLVGENAGSGRFSALALRSYLSGSSNVYHSIANVLDYGAKGDGTTDDTAAIQAVLDGAAGKALVFVPWTGAAFRTAGLTLPSGTDMLLYGEIKLLPGSLTAVVTITSASNISIRGTGTLDGNGAGEVGNAGGPGVLSIHSSSHIRVSGVTLQNAHWWNLNVTASQDVVVDGVTITGGNAANEFAAGSSDCWLTNCLIDGSGNNDYGFCFYGGVTNSGAIGNEVRYAGYGTSSSPPGIGILSDSLQPAACHNILIADNICHHNGAGGISCINPIGGFQTGIIIANNRCYNNLTLPTGAVADIWIDNTTNATVIGNQISACGSSTVTGVAGIFLGPNASYISILSNQIYDIGQGSTNGAGIWNDNAAHVYVSGNYVYDTQTTPTMQYSMIGASGTHNAYVANYLDRPSNLPGLADTMFANATGGYWVVSGMYLSPAPINATNDAAAATAGVPVNGMYRNGSVLMVRVS